MTTSVLVIDLSRLACRRRVSGCGATGPRFGRLATYPRIAASTAAIVAASAPRTFPQAVTSSAS